MGYLRDRVIFSNEALYVSPSATGYHYSGLMGIGMNTPPLDSFSIVGWKCGDPWPAFNAYGESALSAPNHGTVITQLKRIQSISYGFSAGLTDVNQYGHMSRLDSIAVSPAPVDLEFSWYVTDGYNERMIGLVIDGKESPLNQDLSGFDGRNYFIETVPQIKDAASGDMKVANEENTVISLGNCFLTNYSVDISVSSPPTATATVEAFNIKADRGTTGLNVPALNPINGSLISDAWENNQKGVCKANGCTGLFSLPPASTMYSGCADDIAALRPGDVVLQLHNASLMSIQVSGNPHNPLMGSAHIQSANINFDLSRSNITRLGATNPLTKTLDTPIDVTLNISAVMGDLKKGSLTDLICACDTHDLNIKIYDSSCNECERDTSNLAIEYILTKAKLVSENFSSTVGDNKMVDLVFASQIEFFYKEDAT